MEKVNWIANDLFEKFRLNFSRCTNHDRAPLTTGSLEIPHTIKCVPS